MQLEQADFELERIIDNICSLMRERAAEKRLELVVDLQGLPPVLRGDGLRLGQILLNFLGNAVKFTESGSIALRGRTSRVAPGGLIARFEVRDTGVGLTPEQQGRLFQAFEQADTSTTRKYGGTGLGLAISRRLTELMGGRIGVESQLGHGSTFWVEIPFNPGRVGDTRRGRAAPTRGKRALVVDDLPEARESLAAMLESFGVVVGVAPDGATALRLAAEQDAAGNPFDLLLLDWQMPGMDGLEVGRRLDRMPLKRPPACLLVTAYGEGPEPAVLRSAGYRGVLVKPLGPSPLLDALQETFSGRPGYGQRRLPLGEAESQLRRRGHGRVLLVEDNQVNQDVAFELLESVGLEIDLAEDGQRALDKAREGHYDIILMDVQMPVMDGLTATRLIRALPAHGATAIVAMTANAFAEDRDACLAAGMNDHVVKPVDPESLYSALLRWLPNMNTVPYATDTGALGLAEHAVPDPVRDGQTNADLSDIRRKLAGIDGIDQDAGLRFANLSPDLYLRLLGKFLDNRDSALLISALTAGDVQTAKRAAHTIKGLAATLGATRLRALAATLERDIGAIALEPVPPSQLKPTPFNPAELNPTQLKPDQLNEAAHALAAEFRHLCDALRTILPQSATTDSLTVRASRHASSDAKGQDPHHAQAASDPGEAAFTAAIASEVTGRLTALLAADDMAAMTLFRDNEPLLSAALGQEATAFKHHLEDFAFEEALNILRTVAATAPESP
jgi:two-component system sensor histidine kinase/response regulator